MPCSGAAGSICGGPDSLTLFATSVGLSHLNSDLTVMTSTASSASASASASASPSAVALPAGWTGPGSSGSSVCIAEGASGRALTGASTSASDMTYAKCLNYCAGQGFALAGIE